MYLNFITLLYLFILFKIFISKNYLFKIYFFLFVYKYIFYSLDKLIIILFIKLIY